MKILSYSILGLIDPLTMKFAHLLYEKTFLSRVLDETFPLSSISSMISSFPLDRCNDVMRKLTVKGEYVPWIRRQYSQDQRTYPYWNLSTMETIYIFFRSTS